MERVARYTSKGKVGCPRRFSDGWKQANKRIYLSQITFDSWRELKSSLQLPNDDAVAVYLLGCHRVVTNEIYGEQRDSSGLVLSIMQ